MCILSTSPKTLCVCVYDCKSQGPFFVHNLFADSVAFEIDDPTLLQLPYSIGFWEIMCYFSSCHLD